MVDWSRCPICNLLTFGGGICPECGPWSLTRLKELQNYEDQAKKQDEQIRREEQKNEEDY